MPDVGGVAGERLRSFIERIERLEDERRALSEDMREVYAEAKGTGFDPKIMRQIVRLRKLESSDREEQEYLLDIYKAALGMVESLDAAGDTGGDAAAEAKIEASSGSAAAE
jgi:uncharacterized protein (UPF0335 family)